MKRCRLLPRPFLDDFRHARKLFHIPIDILDQFISRQGYFIYFSATCIPQFALVPHDRCTHSTLSHAKEHGLHSAIQLLILIGCLDVREDSFADNRAQ